MQYRLKTTRVTSTEMRTSAHSRHCSLSLGPAQCKNVTTASLPSPRHSRTDPTRTESACRSHPIRSRRAVDARQKVRGKVYGKTFLLWCLVRRGCARTNARANPDSAGTHHLFADGLESFAFVISRNSLSDKNWEARKSRKIRRLI